MVMALNLINPAIIEAQTNKGNILQSWETDTSKTSIELDDLWKPLCLCLAFFLS